MSTDKGLTFIANELTVADHLAEQFVAYCEELLRKHAAFQQWLKERGRA